MRPIAAEIGNNSERLKIKICHVATTTMSHYLLLLNQLLYLGQNGYEVHCAGAADEFTPRLLSQNFPFHQIPFTRKMTPWQDFKALVELTRLFRKEKFKIVHVHTPKAALIGSVAAFISGVPIRIYGMHGLYFRSSSGLALRNFFIIIEWVIARLTHFCLSVGVEDMRLALKYHLFRTDQIALLGPGGVGVNLGKYKPDALIRQRTRQAFGFNSSNPVIGFVGRLTHEKGVREFFHALGQIKGQFPSLRVVVVGPSDQFDEVYYQRLAQRLDIQNIVRFTGLRLDMELIYPAFDIFCLPSYREGKSVVLMEAAACGLPCVASDISGCSEIVRDGITGFLVPPRQVHSLAGRLSELLLNSDLRLKLGQQARREAELHFDETIVFRKLDQVYRQLLYKDQGAISRTQISKDVIPL